MALPNYAVTDDTDAQEAVRAITTYQDQPDEVPQSELQSLLQRAKADLQVKTGSYKWYRDFAYGNALVYHTAILTKAAVENIEIAQYEIGDEVIETRNAETDSQQLSLWAERVKEGLDNSDLNFDRDPNLNLRNTSSYIG